ncbi:YkgJ family cysteine cluster protein [Putridiphycobacter roseus]|uniref:YkgJ family cysteine cluster protein n=1 Tax=Putridiphycobacter roseus TaxID=2219161 RepID=A0A2W1NQV9_9FLAO|nr:YkgJ family cysteine cluster protein [Putridiphycobacter roseus]PZE18042.1 YkgJ family cysteine cluster protein [Putridiphycobacter roseus]
MKKELNNILFNFNNDTKNKKQVLKTIYSFKKNNMDDVFHDAHEKVFKKIDCLDCANCCKTTSPIFRDTDIKRLAKYLRMKSSAFIASYLRVDEDQDYVLKSSPCTFLNEDNTCSVYDYRPLACKGYPHTDRKNMYQLKELINKNTEICPAVCEIVSMVAKK